MKNLFSILAVILLVAVPLYAQKPTLNLPEMQEWYRWDGAQGYYISYLPNFDTANGGANAITQKRSDNPTWFNRFAYDTTNQFTWGSSWIVMPVDFNGDGITDYIDYDGNVYQGMKKNSPPIKVAGVQYEGFKGGEFVEDFDKDGFQDIIVPTDEGRTFMILFGGLDLKKMRQIRVDYLSSRPYSKGISIYLNENGEPRLLTYNRRDYSEGYYLDAIQFETKGDSIVVSLKELSSIQEMKTDKNKQIFEPNVYSFYQSKIKKEYSLIIHTTSNGSNTGESRGYAVEQDKFRYVAANVAGTVAYGCLTGSIDGDSVEDFITPGLIMKNNMYQNGFLVNSGNPITNRVICLYFLTRSCGINEDVKYIGDVTGDGIGDIAYGSSGGCFSIYKGIDWRKLSVEDKVGVADFTLHQTEPNPIGMGGTAVLPATLAHAGNYTLEVFDLTGKRLGELFSGELPIGDVRIPLTIKALNISSGMYTLRLSDGKHTQERAFVINR